MANPLKGEVAFQVEGETYKLVLDFNALCELEDQGIELSDLGDGAGRFKTMRAVFWACLQANHEGVTLREAGDLMGAVGMGKVGDLLTAAMERGGLIGEEPKARPQKAPAKKAAQA